MTIAERLTWRDVYDTIQGRILDSTYSPGTRLPRDEDIALDLGCARATVQRAMRALADEGLIERKRKGGTHVLRLPATRATFHIPVARLEVEATGARYGYQLVSREEADAPRAVAAALEMRAPARMLHVRALHLANQRPYLFEDRWICVDTVPEILDVDLSRENANEWLLQHRPYSRCDLRFFAIKAAADDADLLGAEEGDALFGIARSTWNGSAPITTVTALAPPGYEMHSRA
jgi:GntR family histidine utilization transcriptional repressor